MSDEKPLSSLEIRSTVKKDGTLELTLESTQIPAAPSGAHRRRRDELGPSPTNRVLASMSGARSPLESELDW